MKAAWRAMRRADLPVVTALADRIHVDHPEKPAIFAERLDLFPAGCCVLEQGAAVIGYAIAHPGRLGAPPPLDTLLVSLPEAADCLYLHDIALAPEAARQGHGAELVARMIELAAHQRLAAIALVAVRGSAPFWQRYGFRPSDAPAFRAKLASYGEDAAYMVRATAKNKMPDGL